MTNTIAAMAFATLADLLDDQGNVIPLTEFPRDVCQAVKKIRRRDIVDGQKAVIGHTIEVKMHDKVQPLRLLGLEVGMFTEKVEQSGDDAFLRALREGRERALAR